MIAYYFRRLDKIGRNVEEIRIMGGGIRASLEVVS
jgi:inosine-uridine nucleoside N-ribohydrolase